MGPSAFYFAPTNTSPVNYQQFTFTEVASTSLTRIDFHAVDSNGSILLDNVAVTAAPEPSTALLAGLGLFAAGVWRRSYRAATAASQRDATF